jgi:hypothetical protein
MRLQVQPYILYNCGIKKFRMIHVIGDRIIPIVVINVEIQKS